MASSGPERGGPPRGVFWTVAGIVVAGGAVPVILYWWLVGRGATITPQRAKALLREPASAAVLVDVRPPKAFSTGHIDGAVGWPLEELLAAATPGELPAEFRDKTLLLVCDVGIASRRAAAHLAAIGVAEALNVRGGIQEWIRSTVEELGRQPRAWGKIPPWSPDVPVPKGEMFDRWRTAADEVVEFPFRRSPVFEQAVAVVAFFLIKPVYTLLSLLVAILLWRSRAPDLAALRWGMIFFFLGENACAVNYFVFRETSYLSEYLHSYGMLLCFGFTAYAFLEGVDRRILMLSDPERRCAALALCGRCVKYADVSCGLKQSFYLIIPVLIAVSLMLPLADWQDNSYNTLVFGQLYNYAHLRIYQLFENWYCAAAAILMFAVSLAILGLKRDDPIATAKIAFAAGIGPLGFGMLRMVLGGAYDQNRVWYLFWEEFTELLFILGICFVLWTFRRVHPRRAGMSPDALLPRLSADALPRESPRDAVEA